MVRALLKLAKPNVGSIILLEQKYFACRGKKFDPQSLRKMIDDSVNKLILYGLICLRFYLSDMYLFII